MEPATWMMPAGGDDFRCRALWESIDKDAWHTTDGGVHVESSEGTVIRGGLLGSFHGNPAWSMVWSLWLRPDWTTDRFLAIPQEPWGFATDRLDIRWDGERRWHDQDGRELEPITRDAPFVVWRDAPFAHTPVLRHIGLDRLEPADVEVLQLNVASGALFGTKYRYTPLGGGGWTCYDANYDETSELRVDSTGTVTEIVGRIRRLT